MQVQHPTAPTRVIPENPVHAWSEGYQAAKREPWTRLKARIADGISLDSILFAFLPACYLIYVIAWCVVAVAEALGR